MTAGTLAELLESQAARLPHAPAVVAGSGTLSYAELDSLSARLAGTLKRCGAGRGERMAILLAKDLPAYVAVHAVLRSGAAYVPLDPRAPVERNRRVLRDAGARVLIADGSWAFRLAERPVTERLPVVVPAPATAGTEVIRWEDALDSAPAESVAGPDDLAYILYTSGSTGVPKGVQITHRAARAFVDWAESSIGLAPGDRVAGVAGLHFDLSVFDVFSTCRVGATLLPLTFEELMRPRAVADWLDRERITVWYSTPSTLVLLLAKGRSGGHRWTSLRRVLFAGEVFPPKHVRTLREAAPSATLWNLYGPTETNVCTAYRVDRFAGGDDETLPIGEPCCGAEVRVVRDDGRQAAPGEPGELWVRGPTVMPGYWRRPELDEKAFVADGDGPPWYRTGDVVHTDDHGVLHFHGRRDHMVKVRGYRIEIGELESVLHGHPNVQESVVVADYDGHDGPRLRAWIVPVDPDRYSALDVQRHLSQHLPSYMLPSEYRSLSELPKTSTGKVDRAGLATRP